MQKWTWFTVGMLIGLTILSITRAAEHQKNETTAVSYKKSEVRISKPKKLDLYTEIRSLEKLEHPSQRQLARFKAAMFRISHQKYQYSKSQK